MNPILLFVIILIVAAEACAQYCIKKSNQTKELQYFCAAIGFYALVSLFLYISYNYSYIGLVNALWSGFSVLAIIAVGVIFYHEYLNVYDWFGILLILLGIYFVFVYGHT